MSVADDEIRVLLFNPASFPHAGTTEFDVEVPKDCPTFAEFFGYEPKPGFRIFGADGVEIARGSIGAPIPLAWAPDGAFLTVGYARPFPVTERMDTDIEAPESFLGLSVRTGSPPPLDLEAEFDRVMRHQ